MMENVIGTVLEVGIYVFVYGVVPASFIAYGRSNNKTWPSVVGLLWAVFTLMGAFSSRSSAIQIVGAAIGVILIALSLFVVKPKSLD